jgi:uncharacterized protein (TIGR03437 family)
MTQDTSVKARRQSVTVRIDGFACQLLCVSDRQVNLIAPAMLAGKDVGSEVLLEVLRDGVVIATRPLAVAEADPHLFPHSEPVRVGSESLLVWLDRAAP